MANVLFSRTDSPSTKPITDGQIIFDTSGNGKMYLDNGTTRLEMGGAINVDATLDATSTNPIQNKGVAGVMLSELEEIRGTTKRGFLTDALATKTLDAKIGTTDISAIGDGTVTGGLSYVNGKLSNDVHGSVVGYYAEKQYTINDMQNATKGTIKIINHNGVVTIFINNLVCEPDTAILDINSFVGNNFYMYDKSGTGLYIDNSKLYTTKQNIEYMVLSFCL